HTKHLVFVLALVHSLHRDAVATTIGNSTTLVVTITAHHAVYDGWSVPLIVKDLFAILSGHVPRPAPSSRPFLQFLAAVDPLATEVYWTGSLTAIKSSERGFLPSISHPSATDGALSTGPAFKDLTVAIAPSLTDIKRAAHGFGVTPATMAKAAWAMVLHKFTRVDDVVFGWVVSGRQVPVRGIERMAGAFVNTVPAPFSINPSLALASFLKTTHASHIDSLPHSHVSMSNILKWLNKQTSDQLMDSLLVFQNNESVPDTVTTDSFSVRWIDRSGNISDYPLTVEVVFANDSSASVSLAYKATMFSDEIVASIGECLASTIARMCDSASTNLMLGDLVGLSESEMAAVVALGTGPSVPLDPNTLLQHRFEHHAATTPDSIAIECGDNQITYGEANRRANVLAHQLRSLGVTRNVPVAILTSRSVEMIVGLLAILKADGVYVPIDASYPVHRIESMIADVSPLAIIHTVPATPLEASISASIRQVFMNQTDDGSHDGSAAPQSTNDGTALAYILFTSGSTGKPKGVTITHGGAVNTIDHVSRDIAAAAAHSKRYLLSSAMTFDYSMIQIFPCFDVGGCLVVPPELNFDAFKHCDVAMTTPSLINSMGAPDDYTNIRFLMSAGERITNSTIQLWRTRSRLYNGYGPTETAIVITTKLFNDDVPTIGKPIQNGFVMIMDKSGRPVPVGVAGELWIGGVGVSPGYVSRPDLTAERFTINPFFDNMRMYRSGDLVRWTANGELECFGRIDHQVKIRGIRIELDEITSTLDTHMAQVSASCATVKSDRIVVFVSPASVDIRAVRSTIESHLPAHMWPTLIVPLEQLPINNNGKIDRLALDAIEVSFETNETIQPAETETEMRLVDTWSRVLGVEVAKIGTNHTFFEAGGDSLKAIAVVSEAQKAGIEFSVKDLFEHPTIADLASAIDGDSLSKPKLKQPSALVSNSELAAVEARLKHFDIAAEEVENILPATPLQQVLLEWVKSQPHAFGATDVFEVRNVSLDQITDSWKRLSDLYETIRTRFVSTEYGVFQVILSPDSTHCEKPILLSDPSLLENISKPSFLETPDSSYIENRAFMSLYVAECYDSEQTLRVVITNHHAIYDGTCASFPFLDFYKLFSGESPQKRPSQRGLFEYVSSLDKVATAKYWQGLLHDHGDFARIPSIQVPGMETRKHLRYIPTAHAKRSLETDLQHMTSVARKRGATIGDLAQAAWGLTLSSICGKPKIAFGSLLSRRNAPVPNFDRTMGAFTNIIPVVLNCGPGSSVDNLLRAIQDQRVHSFDHMHVTFTELTSYAQAADIVDVIETMLLVQINPENSSLQSIAVTDAPGVPNIKHLGSIHPDYECMDQPLECVLEFEGGQPTFNFYYAAKIYDTSVIQRLADTFASHLLDIFSDDNVADPAQC
ncbi:uncharacterized protein BJ171DRAFT_535152, partial [Polychytrium aggregatum]|uniref:uncharacterized protein n=1 Tax=Polychytrium aggregatum TaxID=110093 RepID=UPI0022FF2EB3